MRVVISLILILSCFGVAHAQPVHRVYLAGPLFTEGERMEMEKIASVLEDEGFETFLPHRDGLEFNSIFPYLIETLKLPPDTVARQMHYAIDALDVYQVAFGTDSIVMNINGRTPDEGAVAELAMAWTLGKPGVVFRADSRSLSNGRNNPLVMGRSDFVEARDLQQLPVLLRNQIRDYDGHPPLIRELPLKLAQKVAAGEKIWNLLKDLRRQNATTTEKNSRVAQLLENLFPQCELLLK